MTIGWSSPKEEPVLTTFEKYSEFEGNSVLPPFVSCGQEPRTA